MARDTQRNRIYRAETSFNLATHGSHHQEPLWELQSFVDTIERRAWWKRQNIPKILLNDARGAASCVPTFYRDSIQVYLRNDEMTRAHVLHRMAHAVLGQSHSNGETPHDVEFVKMYLELMRRFYTGNVDEDTKRTFKKFLVAEKVKTKIVSDATKEKQRAAMVKRLTPTEDELLNTLRSIEEM